MILDWTMAKQVGSSKIDTDIPPNESNEPPLEVPRLLLQQKGFLNTQIDRLFQYSLMYFTDEQMWVADLNATNPMTWEQVEMAWGYMQGNMNIEEMQAERAAENALLVRYSNFPEMDLDYGENGLNHLEYLFNDPNNFFNSVISVGDQQITRENKLQYFHDIQGITQSTIEAVGIDSIFDQVELDNMVFALDNVYLGFPGAIDYKNKRWLMGSDGRPDEWLKVKIDTINELNQAGDSVSAEMVKSDTIKVLEKYNTDIIDRLDQPSKVYVIQTLAPPVTQVYESTEIIETPDPKILAAKMLNLDIEPEPPQGLWKIVLGAVAVVGLIFVAQGMNKKKKAKTPEYVSY